MGVSVTLSGLCIIAVLPQILDCQSDCRNKFVKKLLQMGEKYKSKQWGVSVTLSGLCIIAVLPHILDCQSDCRNKYVKILLQMGEKYKAKLWG